MVCKHCTKFPFQCQLDSDDGKMEYNDFECRHSQERDSDDESFENGELEDRSSVDDHLIDENSEN